MDGTALEYYKRHERHGAAMGNEMSDATIAERARMARVAHELREQGYRESLAKKAAASKPKMTREERERLFQEAYREFHQELRRQIEAGER